MCDVANLIPPTTSQIQILSLAMKWIQTKGLVSGYIIYIYNLNLTKPVASPQTT